MAAGNSGLKGVLGPGGAVATDANTVTFTLIGGNGNFPYLVSVFNAQTLITPKAYVAGTTLDKSPNGTGAWKLATYNQQTGATFTRNDAWWGGKTPLDGTEFIFFDATGPMVTAYQGQQVDAIVQFDVLSGASLLSDTNFNLIATEAALHRQIWMRCDKGQFARKEVRQALAYTFDRPALVQQLFQGKAQLGNDHVIWQGYPYYDSSVPQRAQDIAKAKALLSAAGVTNLTADLHAVSSSRSRISRRCSRARPSRPASPSTSRSRASTPSTAHSGARTSPPIRRARAPPSSASSTTATAPRRTSTSTRRSRPRASGIRRSIRRPRSTLHSSSSRPRSASTRRRPRARRSRRS